MAYLESLPIVISILQLAGLLPFTIHKNGKLQSNWFWRIVLIAHFLIFGAGFLHGAIESDDFFDETTNNIGRTVDLVQLTGIRMAHLLTIVESLFRYKFLIDMMNRFSELDSIFKRELNVDISKENRFKRKIYNWLTVVGVFYILTEIFGLIVIAIKGNVQFYTFWLSYLLPFIVTSLRYFQIGSTVYLVNVYLSALNHELTHIELDRTINNDDTVMADKFISIIGYKINQNYPNKYKTNKINENLGIGFHRLIVIREIYDHIWDISNLISKCFGISLLANIANDFLSITSSCYWIFISFTEDTLNSSSMLINIMQTTGSIIWAIPHVINVVAISAICYWTTETANETALITHKIDYDLNNEYANTFIEQFSLQMLHQKITFSAYGFFKIDFTLLYTIAGATTTYLIILIQFHMSEQQT